MRISDWSSDVCSSDLQLLDTVEPRRAFDGQHGLINQPQLILGDGNAQIEFGPATTLNRFGHFGTEDNRPSPPCFLRAVKCYVRLPHELPGTAVRRCRNGDSARVRTTYILNPCRNW